METTSFDIAAKLRRPLTAAVVADLHSEPFEEVLEKLAEISPSLVLCPGDILHRANEKENGLEFLRRSAELFPTFCSLGNHEFKHGTDVRQFIKKTGAVLLDNEWTTFEDVVIGGLSTGYGEGEKQGRLKATPRPHTERLEGFFECEGFKILLSHHPEYYPKYLKDKKVDLIVSGHAHGGQWRILGHGVFAPGQGLFPKYTSGLYDGKLLVSRGLANMNRIPRIFNEPQLLVVNLK